MKKLYQQIFENHRLKQLNERTGWKMGPQFWDTDEPIAKPTPRNPAISPSQPYVPTPGFNGDPDVYVNQPGPGMPSPTRANEPLNIPPSLPTYPLADPRLSDTNKPMRVPRPRNPNEILPGIFNTGTINKPNGNSPPVIWYQDLNNGKWYKAILMCYQSGCVYASQADDPLMVRDSPPDGFVIWNPSPPPGRFEVYHDPEFEWFKPSTWGW